MLNIKNPIRNWFDLLVVSFLLNFLRYFAKFFQFNQFMYQIVGKKVAIVPYWVSKLNLFFLRYGIILLNKLYVDFLRTDYFFILLFFLPFLLLFFLILILLFRGSHCIFRTFFIYVDKFLNQKLVWPVILTSWNVS